MCVHDIPYVDVCLSRLLFSHFHSWFVLTYFFLSRYSQMRNSGAPLPVRFSTPFAFLSSANRFYSTEEN